MAAPAPRGVYTAIVTPFTKDGSAIDFDAYQRLLEMQLEASVAGVVPCGTTGETPTLSDAEQIELIRFTKKTVGSRLQVLAGSGSNSTQKTIAASLAALEAGADSVMVVMPYYNKPNQAGLLHHIESVARAVDAPIVLYNIPARSCVELSVESTLSVLSACPNVVGVKDATGTLNYSQQLLGKAGDRVNILSGDDALTLPMLSVGACGVISVASNVYPRSVVSVVDAALRGDYAVARQEHLRLIPVFQALFQEPNPAPIKAALHSKGLIDAQVRSPIVPVSPACRDALLAAMRCYEEAGAG